MSVSYIPRNDNALIDWGQKLLTVSNDPLNHTRWGILKPKDELMDLYSDFATKLANCKTGYRSPADVLAKNVAKDKMVKAFRDFVQGYLARNVNVTEHDRLLLGLPQRDTIPTTVLDPTGQAKLTITYPARLLRKPYLLWHL